MAKTAAQALLDSFPQIRTAPHQQVALALLQALIDRLQHNTGASPETLAVMLERARPVAPPHALFMSTGGKSPSAFCTGYTKQMIRFEVETAPDTARSAMLAGVLDALEALYPEPTLHDR